jgi:hypothetical protein
MRLHQAEHSRMSVDTKFSESPFVSGSNSWLVDQLAICPKMNRQLLDFGHHD